MSQIRPILPGSKVLSSTYPSEAQKNITCASLTLVALLTLCQDTKEGGKLAMRKELH